MKTKYYLITVIIVMFAFFTFLITYFLGGCHNTKASHYEPIARPTTQVEYPKIELEAIPVVETPPAPSAEELRWAQIEEEYPVAAKVWNYLKLCGWNDYVCAGIMGNLMRETGGDTLNLKPTLYDSSRAYYGICQWSKKYCPEVQGKDLDYQLDYLKTTIEKEFLTFGKLYKNGFVYWHFTQLTNERDAALAFAKCYERCSSAGYTKRQNNATTAYKYFVG